MHINSHACVGQADQGAGEKNQDIKKDKRALNADGENQTKSRGRGKKKEMTKTEGNKSQDESKEGE